jgi:hypothetical protein
MILMKKFLINTHLSESGKKKNDEKVEYLYGK